MQTIDHWVAAVLPACLIAKLYESLSEMESLLPAICSSKEELSKSQGAAYLMASPSIRERGNWIRIDIRL